MITTVVFDLDDTLYDEIDYCRSGFAAVAGIVADRFYAGGAQEVFDTLWRQFTSGNHTRTFNSALDELNITYDGGLVRGLIESYRNHAPDITLPADSRDVLDELRHRYKLAMLTDGFMPAQQSKVRSLGIENYFEQIVYTEQLGREYWKPSPVGFEKLIEELGEKAENMAYIGDNEAKDFIAPDALGFATIRITRTNGIHAEPAAGPEGAARHYIEHIGDVVGLLEQL